LSEEKAITAMTMTTIKREPTTMFALLLSTMLAAHCDGLCPTLLPSLASSSLLLSSSSSLSMAVSSGSDISRARQRDREPKTLYDYLGASPKDTQEQLKVRYTILAKTLHPDSNPDRDVENSYYDLSEINAAWEVLKDPVERKRYDRSMQTKEISENIDSIVSMGIESFVTTAIPFFKKTASTTAAAMQKTASTTAAAVDASTKAAKEANEQANKVYGAFEIDKKIKALEQKSNADKMRASKLQKEIAALPTKKISSIEKKQQQQQPLSSVEAQRILKNFQATTMAMKPPPASLKSEIKLLTNTEIKHRDAQKACQSTKQTTQLATRKVEQALKAEEMAQKRLEEAQRAFNEAKQSHVAAQEGDRKAKADERLTLQSSTKIETNLQKTREKVRVGLLQQQDIFLVSRANELKKEKQECEKTSENYLKEAKELRIKAKEEKKRK
jgi:curved DNA-binding protein CbpA